MFETLSLDPLEQKKIAAVLLKIQRAIETQEKTIQSFRDLFKTTLNKLMTGEVRVGDLDIDVSEVEV